jgi:hypothetical protein
MPRGWMAPPVETGRRTRGPQAQVERAVADERFQQADEREVPQRTVRRGSRNNISIHRKVAAVPLSTNSVENAPMPPTAYLPTTISTPQATVAATRAAWCPMRLIGHRAVVDEAHDLRYGKNLRSGGSPRRVYLSTVCVSTTLRTSISDGGCAGPPMCTLFILVSFGARKQ